MSKKLKKHTRRGTEPAPRHDSQGIAPSMAAASALSGITRRALQAAKRAGCPAFHASGRVHLDRLQEWLAENPEVLDAAGDALSKDTELALKTRADRMLREHKLAVLRGEYVTVKQVEAWGAQLPMSG
jgi:hypothetical protein